MWFRFFGFSLAKRENLIYNSRKEECKLWQRCEKSRATGQRSPTAYCTTREKCCNFCVSPQTCTNCPFPMRHWCTGITPISCTSPVRPSGIRADAMSDPESMASRYLTKRPAKMHCCFCLTYLRPTIRKHQSHGG